MIPDPLRLRDGSLLATPEQWAASRRPELLELFREHVYGRVPCERPDRLSFRTTEDAVVFGGFARRRRILISWSAPQAEGALPVFLYTPEPAAAGKPAGTLVHIAVRERELISSADEAPNEFWPVREIVARGYATAAFHKDDAAPDDPNDGFRRGVFAGFEPPRAAGELRPANAWGTIAAWSWAASRVVDFIEAEPSLRRAPVSVVGHSRGGKAALWCGAQDERVALAISNNSGCTGAALARVTRGETIAEINARFPHWFARNYHRYNGAEDLLPVDQHELLALLAPRLVYVASASEDAWADPAAEFRACTEAAPVFRLHGLDGPRPGLVPSVGTPLHDGAIGYHLRAGGHDLRLEDWRHFLDFADRHLGIPD